MSSLKNMLSFILILTLLFSISGLSSYEGVYAAPGDNVIDLEKIDQNATEVTIIRSDTHIAASTGGGIFTSGPAAEGIVITGTRNEPDFGIIIDGKGSNSEFDVKLSDTSITMTGDVGLNKSIIELKDKANVKLTLTGKNNLSRTLVGTGAAIEISSPEALNIIGDGELLAIGLYGAAAIGGNVREAGSNITIAGDVDIEASGGVSASAIGGGYYGAGRDINISGGKVVAKGGDKGAGIGGGYRGNCNNVTINGDAEIDALGGSDGAGIGGGLRGNADKIDISGTAVVSAKSTNDGAGIGGGKNDARNYNGTGNNITIRGNSTVNVEGGQGAGIGGGNSGTGSGIRILDDAKVNAIYGIGGAGIGGGDGGFVQGILITGNAIVKASPKDFNSYGCGIGGGSTTKRASGIVISGNTSVSAIGKYAATGIGVGYIGVLMGSEQKPALIISGNANVYASATMSGAAIGAGPYGTASGIEIRENARVTAFGGKYGAGIGTGRRGITTELLKIKGGFVTASGGAVNGADDIGGGQDAKEVKKFRITGGSIHVVHDKWGTTLSAFDANNEKLLYRVTVPAVYKDTTESLKGNLDFSIRISKMNHRYVAKTVSSGAAEHGPTFPSEAAAYIYLPVGTDHCSATLGEYKYGYVDVVSKPATEFDNILLWDNMVKVFYDKNGADEINTTTAVITYGAAFGELPKVTRAGYSFDNWYTADNITVIDTTPVTPKNATTIYAFCRPNKYTVLFDGNGETEISFTDKSVTYDSIYDKLPVVTKPGYTFNGWYDDSFKEITSGSIVKTTSNHTLTAKWIQNKYTIAFDKNGGSGVSLSDKSVTYDEKYGALATATNPGYTFDGWYTTTSFAVEITSGSIVKTPEDHVLYAKWKANEYTVTFDKNLGDSVTQPDKSVTYNDNYGILAAAERIGYTFDGWYTSTSYAIEITSGSIVKTTDDHTLYARWKANEYSVSFDKNKGDSVSQPSKTVTFDENYGALPTAERTGYTFDGWYTTTSYIVEITAGSIVKTADNHTLYAKWLPNMYTLSFNKNGGNSVTPASKLITYDSAYGDLGAAYKPGYSFVGWYTSAQGGTQILATDIVNVTQDITLYARWASRDYTASFDPNGGSNVTPSSKSVTYDEIYGTLPTTLREGYTFLGWHMSPSGRTRIQEDSIVKIENDTTFIARWIANNYVISFDKNGGDDVFPSFRIVTYDYAHGELPVATRAGYSFAGWQTESSGGDEITPTDIVKNANDTTLFAKWIPKDYSVTLNVNGGNKLANNSKKVTKDSTYGSLPVPTKKGHSFKGWFTAKTGGAKITADTKVEITDDQILFAQWKANTYKITFKKNAKKVKKLKPKSKKVVFNTKLGKLPKPKKAGYKFKGWYTKKKGGSKVTKNSIMKYDKNIKLYAKWAKKRKG